MAKDKVVEQDKQLSSAPAGAAVAEPTEEVGLVTARPTTDANVWIQVIGSVICTIRLCSGLHFLNKTQDIAILKSIDFRRFRPKIVSVEILVAGKTETTPEVAAFMDGLGYVQRGTTFPNGIFVDRAVLKKA